VISMAKSIIALNRRKIMTKLFRFAAFIPAVKAYLDKEANKVMKDCAEKFTKARKGQALAKLPAEGTS